MEYYRLFWVRNGTRRKIASDKKEQMRKEARPKNACLMPGEEVSNTAI